jgi:hypothetical protein
MPKSKNSRKHVRFKPDPLDVAYIQFTPKGESEPPAKFKPDCVAYIEELAPFGGCGLVISDRPELQAGAVLRIQLGPLSPLLGKIVYKNTLSERLVRLGCQFLE